MDLYSLFVADLQKEFRDFGYDWSRAKELSCDWILSRLPKGVGVDVGGTAYLVKKIQEDKDREITYFDFFPPKDRAIKKHVAADMSEFGNNFQPASLDFITTRHTLEHAINPLFQLWQFNRALKDNGTLIVIVPQHSKKWVWFFSHFNCLPLENWLMLFHRTGFAVKEATAGSWKQNDPEFIEYRFVLQVQNRGITLGNQGGSADDLLQTSNHSVNAVKEHFRNLYEGNASYFASYNEEALKKDVFPYNPSLFNEIAKKREIGIPQIYKDGVNAGPVNEQMVFFESNLGRQYAGNPRYIYERMLKRFPNFDYVWCYEGKAKLPGNPVIVKRASAEYYAMLAKSRFVINNATLPLWYHRPETFYFQTWHGTPFMRLCWDISSRPIDKRSSADFYVKSTGWNALLSPNHHSTEAYRTAFRYEGEIVEFGYPANDIFYDGPRYKKVREATRKLLGITEDVPVYLYAPAKRDDKYMGNGVFEFDLMFDQIKFIEHAPPEAILLIRPHYKCDPQGKLKHLSDRVLNVSDFDDVVELMCAADVLISDYSSIVFDWYCSRKPVLYFVPDYERYVDLLRGSYFDLSEYGAGAICKTEQELYAALKYPMQTSSNDFYEKFCSLHAGTASDKVIDFLLSK